MDSMKIKLVLIGPAKVGKSRIANYLAEFEENPNFETYNPTVREGVRGRWKGEGGRGWWKKEMNERKERGGGRERTSALEL